MAHGARVGPKRPDGMTEIQNSNFKLMKLKMVVFAVVSPRRNSLTQIGISLLTSDRSEIRLIFEFLVQYPRRRTREYVSIRIAYAARRSWHRWRRTPQRHRKRLLPGSR